MYGNVVLLVLKRSARVLVIPTAMRDPPATQNNPIKRPKIASQQLQKSARFENLVESSFCDAKPRFSVPQRVAHPLGHGKLR